MKNHTLLISIAGIVASLFAIVLNLAEGTTATDQRTLAIAAVIAAVTAISIAVATLRKGGAWRWWAIAIGGPALFVLADAGIRAVLFLK